MEKALSYAQEHFEDSVTGLEDFLRIPSISTNADSAGEVKRAANWLADELRRIGVKTVEVHETAGHPIVYAEHLVDDAKPTILVYGHYDVQPPDPLDLWTSPPFEPTRKNGVLYGRGTCDDKGQLFMHVKAAEAYLQSGDALPLNLKMVFEGEEETGSEHIVPFVRKNKERMKADVVVVSDTAMFDEGVPSITYGLRGMAYVEVKLTGPDRDLHSGVYGGAIENPINALAKLIAGLHDEDHRVTLPGFYDSVRPLSDEERATYKALPFDEGAFIADAGAPVAKTETGYSPHEASTGRPTLDCNGIWGGYIEPGAKTVLPSTANAKISMRLVPNQTSEKAAEQLERYFKEHTPDTMKLDFKYLHGGKAVLVDTTIPAMQATAEAMEGVFGRKPFFTREGGSIPIVADFKEILGIDTVLMGFGLNSDAIHSPNECFGLERFRQGIETSIRFMKIFGERVA
jgi:acetylornithine deacetylase/succinyl-diaminopimelate desuccinylase-like protein